MPASFSCQRSPFRFDLLPTRNVSAPGGAQHRFGADAATPACPRQANKKPGVERRACPSFRFGCLLPWQPPERMCSKLVLLQIPGVRNQPHLLVSGRARFVRGLPRKSGRRQHRESIATSCISSSLRNVFLIFKTCGIHRMLWKAKLVLCLPRTSHSHRWDGIWPSVIPLP
jgi:hypothetical protein